MPANPYGHLLTKKAGWAICPKCQVGLGHSLTKPEPSTKNTDKFLANLPRILDSLQRILTILGHLPRNPGLSAKNANKSSSSAEKSWATCQECQQILGHLQKLPRTAIKICLPRMPSLPWLALAAGSFGSLDSR